MKKRMSLMVIVVLLASLAFTSATALANSNLSNAAKPGHPTKEPGMQATKKAEGHGNQGNGSGNGNQGNGNPQGQALEATADPAATEEPEATEDVKQPKQLHFRGFVATVDEAGLTITLRNSAEEITFAVTDETEVKVPTLWQCSTCADLVTGTQVLVRAMQDETGQLVALDVHVIPGKPTKMHRVGVVTDHQEGVSITILAKDGQEYTFQLTDKTLVLPLDQPELLVVGAEVTIIAPRDVTGQPVTARGIVVHTDTDDTDVDDPEATVTPGGTDEPGATVTPGATDEPVITITPETTEEPDVTTTPEVTEEPVVTETPEVNN